LSKVAGRIWQTVHQAKITENRFDYIGFSALSIGCTGLETWGAHWYIAGR